MRKKILMIVTIVLSFFQTTEAQTTMNLVPGEGMFVYDKYEPFSNKPLDVHYYIPKDVDAQNIPIIFVFQGADRNYSYLMRAWKDEAEKNKFILIIPQFDKESYPLSDYQEMGVMNREHTTYRKPQEYTSALIDRIFCYVKDEIKSKRDKYMIYGHSAGGQFVQRFMLFSNSPYVERAIIGSPGWYTFPDDTLTFPYGIKDNPNVSEGKLKEMFNKDIVVQLATGDTIRESFLRKTPEADLQGRNRLERGRTFFKYAKQLCARKGWNFRWRLVEVEGLGHVSVEMGIAALPLLLMPNLDDYTTTQSIENIIPSLSEIKEQLKNLCKAYPKKIQLSSVGITPEGIDIPIAYIHDKSSKSPIRVWMQGSLHGNEPAGAEILSFLSSYLLKCKDGEQILKDIEFAFVPVANPYGYSKQKRYSGSGLDLNRDQTKLMDSVTVMLKKAYLSFQPHVSLDIHEYNPIRKEFQTINGHQLETDYDVLFLPSGHPNISDNLRDLSVNLFQKNAEKTLKQYGFTYGQYFTLKNKDGQYYTATNAKSPQSSSTWQALSNSISLFVEIKGIGMKQNLFNKRVDCGMLIANSILETICDNKKEILDNIMYAEQQTISANTDIAVNFDSPLGRRTISFIDKETFDVVKKEFNDVDALQSKATLIRQRPKGYLLDASCRAAVEKLKEQGVEVKMTTKPQSFIVEKYNPVVVEQSKEPWERIYPVNVKCDITKTKIKLPKGSYFVKTSQSQGNLLVTLMEPESANGFISFSVIDVEKGKNLPYYRLIK